MVDAQEVDREKHDDLCVLLAAWLLQDAGVAIDEKALAAVIEASGNRVDPELPLLFAAVLDKESEPGGEEDEEGHGDETDEEEYEDEDEDDDEEGDEATSKQRSGAVCCGRGPECEDVVSCCGRITYVSAVLCDVATDTLWPVGSLLRSGSRSTTTPTTERAIAIAIAVYL